MPLHALIMAQLGRTWNPGCYSSLTLEHSNNAEFWLNKIQGNIERDRKIEAELHGKGWFVLRFWSKDILYRTDECVRTIDELIFSLETYEI